MEEGSQREKRRICGASSRVGLLFCGRQSPGGHNVVLGLHEALKIHNPKSTLLGFLGGSEGLFAQKTLEITDDVLATYKNQGGYDLLGRTKDQIRTTKKVNFGMAACKALKLDGLVIVGGVTSNTDAAELAETFAEAKCATKVVGVPVILNGDLKNQFVEANVGFDTICKLNAEARQILVDSYVALRKGDIAPGSRNAYHIKVRQLEALIRLSEAITRCHPDDDVHPRHVRLVTRRLKTSVISVESTEIDLTEFQDDIQEENQEDGDIGGNGESQPSGADAKLTNEYPENAEVAAKKLVITDEYFQWVTQALVMRLRQHEETMAREAGMKQRDRIQ